MSPLSLGGFFIFGYKKLSNISTKHLNSSYISIYICILKAISYRFLSVLSKIAR